MAQPWPSHVSGTAMTVIYPSFTAKPVTDLTFTAIAVTYMAFTAMAVTDLYGTAMAVTCLWHSHDHSQEYLFSHCDGIFSHKKTTGTTL